MKKFIAIAVVAMLSVAITPSMGVNHLPPKFSWRDVDGIDYTTPVKDQEPCPSCEAYALVAAVETLIQYEVGHPFGCDLSEMHLFFCSGGTCKWGVDVKDAAQYLVEYGTPDEGCCPDMHRTYDMPCNFTLPGWESRAVKIKEWGWVENNEESIKEALIKHGPLVACISVYEDFMHYHGGIYRHRWGKRVGGHLITIVGYDDEQQCWICKNSWGTGWGEEGWFRVAYDSDVLMKRCYGGTGVLYVDGVYGNFMPDVPRVYIDEPRRYHTYIFNMEFPSLFDMAFFHDGTPLIIGGLDIELSTNNTERVEFYLDGKLMHEDDSSPYTWHAAASYGLHEIRVMAYSASGNASMAGIDAFFI